MYKLCVWLLDSNWTRGRDIYISYSYNISSKSIEDRRNTKKFWLICFRKFQSSLSVVYCSTAGWLAAVIERRKNFQLWCLVAACLFSVPVSQHRLTNPLFTFSIYPFGCCMGLVCVQQLAHHCVAVIHWLRNSSYPSPSHRHSRKLWGGKSLVRHSCSWAAAWQLYYKESKIERNSI